MSGLRLPRLLSDGVVLQRRKAIHIWGWDEAGSQITASLVEDNAETASKENVLSLGSISCNKEGRFDLYLPARESGGPYKLVVSDDSGESITVNDVMIGLVWFCSGQSNMELPVIRVKDKYPELLEIEDNSNIRTFKITEDSSFEGPLEELRTGSWTSVNKDSIISFSATGYFFAKHLQMLTGQTVGFINASLGGSRISSWMSRQMLEGYDELLAEADKYSDADFRKQVMETNMVNGDTWRRNLYESDLGFKEHWESYQVDKGWDEFQIPGFFKGTVLDGFIGSVWFRRKFDLPRELAGEKARLFLGTIVDNDVVFINGQRVGDTPYQYPPRKYDIPEGLTREKDNTIVIRVCVETGLGRFTPGKDYKIFNEETSVRLDGTWEYRVGASCDMIPPTDFINWKSTGLYNAMTYPCHNFPIDGVCWYQGESNVEDGYDYNALTKRQVEGYRKAWNEENLPFIGVSLPNFTIDCPVDDDWGRFRLTQAGLLNLPATGLAITMGLGEDNDLHPVTKEPIGARLALCAAHLKYCYNGEYMGPEVTSVKRVVDQAGQKAFEVKLSHAKGLCVVDAGKGTEITDIYVKSKKDKVATKVIIDNDNGGLLVYVEDDKAYEEAKEIMWCVDNTYTGGLISNETGIPMGPFLEVIDGTKESKEEGKQSA
ncbi:sialate O-acetylesterase [Butyrivibrio sp. VCB2006]|uniref:sialate O-acetylesterase n=1 Tax=Butyrivibrio sp. VCB2006 TaxID=1280679 RepID=UPI0004922F1D|nr:sialate O-acetylesterase [Butyrivibrio sp. VCB2006]